ncbi:MAG TPA: DinB family protein [Acidimicrobiales bacterium]|jgi:hypothetical protein|nr:DinB family protein [Acidimicrobiales bacterium]
MTINHPDRERLDLVAALQKQRRFLVQTVAGLGDDDARRRTTVSTLCLGGLIKHVAWAERAWQAFMTDGSAAFDQLFGGPATYEDGFWMLEGETLSGLLAGYERVASETDRIIGSMPSLDSDHALPDAPWFEAGARWSARRVVAHILAETAQHAGHADIIRESLDGAKTMG